MSDAVRPDTPGSGSPPPRPRPAPEPGPPPVNPRVYRLVVDTTYLPVLFSGMHLEVHGRENVPAPGTPLVVAANHVSSLDPFLVARALPPGRFLQFMAKKELFLPGIGDIIRAGGSFPVDRSGNDLGAVRTALRILKANGTVGIFPQGTRGGAAMQGGVALIAAKGRAPILPAGLSREGKRWIVHFGEPISPRGGIKAVTAQLAEVLGTLAVPVGQRL
ncbi:1-acyl-sn-glycerol-3-phosphate acyltransferase [Deinococcus taeanensis]|uniref:lysophospholipid acyltransferase family protein n=1 Tax=Deinococcus taeanensis TaxID=2737050 RepID=UPI001CDD7D44|nr:lysophospholipid acyltransferase family protein [Deinococcus taeanensis]UBV42939.1 1-acyl-sn-glycerol-3-phosphate acyltransferase [Deinococcus taeanensis]